MYSTGLNGCVIEWNFITLDRSSKVDIGSPIWDSCIYEESLFLACQDGSIREYSFEEQKEVLKVVSVESHWAMSITPSFVEKYTFFVGYDDGSIWRWKQRKGAYQSTQKISTPSQCIIWQIKEIDSQYLCTGDSTGSVIVWAKRNGNPVKIIKELQADVLTITCSKDMIYASGIDSKVISIWLIQEENSIVGSTEGLKQWIYAGSIWGQSHDVKSLCLLNETTLISGGMTTDICIYPLIEGRLME